MMMSDQAPALKPPQPLAVGQPSAIGSVDFLTVLRRRHRIIFGTAGLIMIAALLFLALAQRRYQAVATMLVDTDEIQLPVMSSDVEATATTLRDATALRQFKIDTQVQLLSSRNVARKVVRDLALHDDDEFNPQADDERIAIANRSTSFRPDDAKTRDKAGKPVMPVPLEVTERATDRLMARIKVAQDGNTDFIKVAVTSKSPGKAARIANKITSTYMTTQIEERSAFRRRMAEALGRRVEELRVQLIDMERNIADYRRAHGIDATIGTETLVAQAGRLASELASTRGEAAVAATRSRGGGEVMSPLLADLRGQQSSVQRNLAQLTTMYGEAHPDVRKAGAELEQLQAQISQEQARIRSQLETEASAQMVRESRLSGDLMATRSQSLNLGVLSVPLAEMEREAAATQAVYVRLLSRLKETRRQDEMVSADASVSARAAVLTKPSFPRPGQVIGVAATASVVFGVVLALIMEAIDGQVRTASQVKLLTGMTTLGMVPDVSHRRQATPAFLTVIQRPYTAFAETVRSVAAALERQFTKSMGNVVLITSPLPGDGKTTLAIGLAAAAVATRRSAILVDLDLRRPGLSSYLGSAVIEKDLLDYLDGKATVDEIIIANPDLPKVMAVPVVRPADDPGNYLASPRLAELFEALKQRFQIVIINSPPTLAVGDARIIARLADSTLMVLRWGKTSPDLLRAAFAHFDGEVCYAVFNRVDYAKHARMFYGDTVQHYRQYQAYQQPASRSPFSRLRLLQHFNKHF